MFSDFFWNSESLKLCLNADIIIEGFLHRDELQPYSLQNLLYLELKFTRLSVKTIFSQLRIYSNNSHDCTRQYSKKIIDSDKANIWIRKLCKLSNKHVISRKKKKKIFSSQIITSRMSSHNNYLLTRVCIVG